MPASISILHTKLHIPRLRANRILRARLTARLDEGLSGNLIVISAPAGSGKTTLLAEWVEHRTRRAARAGEGVQGRTRSTAPVAEQFAWLWLEDSDNDPIRFLAYLLASLRRIAPGLGEQLFDGIQARQPLQVESMVIDLLNEVVELPGRLILVLDDYHVIKAPTIHTALAYLVEHLPANLLLVIASRSDPPLPLARLRARGQVLELRQEDLRFTLEETIQFLNQTMGLTLTTEQAAVLEQHTEGWVAGLQMAAVSLHGRQDIEGFLEEFNASHRFVLEYLLEEVLNRQDLQIRSFLLQTSILDRLCAPLCEALLDPKNTAEPQPRDPHPATAEQLGDNAQAILEHLERSNLFIIPLDEQRQWYRYHHLFAELLRHRLEVVVGRSTLSDESASGQTQLAERQLSLPTPAELHRRASVWHANQGSLPDAIEHSLAAEDYSAAAALIARAAEETFINSELTTLLGWLETLPEAVISERPDLCLYHAIAMLTSGHSLKQVENRLRGVQSGKVPGPLASVASALDSFIASLRGDDERSMASSQNALAMLAEPDSFLGSLAISLLEISYVLHGEISQAHKNLAQALEISTQAGNLLTSTLLRCQIGDLYVFEGRLHQAYEVYHEALRDGKDKRGRPVPVAGMALLGLGEILREWNDLASAEKLLHQGFELSRRWGEITSIEGYISLARIKQAQGLPVEARAAIEQAANTARRFDLSDMDDRMVWAFTVRLLTYQGELEKARNWLEKTGIDLSGPVSGPRLAAEPDGKMHSSAFFPGFYLYELEWMAAARLLLALGRSAEALDALQALLPLAEEGSRMRSIVEILVLQSLAHIALGDETQALRCLDRSLVVSIPEGYVRLYLDEAGSGDAALPGLFQKLQSMSTPETAQAIGRLRAFLPDSATTGAHTYENATIQLLSERELEVLHWLAAGQSNEEIAAQLTVAISTVKSHVHNILNKLGANSRLAAVQRAREVGLLK